MTVRQCGPGKAVKKHACFAAGSDVCSQETEGTSPGASRGERHAQRLSEVCRASMAWAGERHALCHSRCTRLRQRPWGSSKSKGSSSRMLHRTARSVARMLMTQTDTVRISWLLDTGKTLNGSGCSGAPAKPNKMVLRPTAPSCAAPRRPTSAGAQAACGCQSESCLAQWVCKCTVAGQERGNIQIRCSPVSTRLMVGSCVKLVVFNMRTHHIRQGAGMEHSLEASNLLNKSECNSSPSAPG